MKFDYDDYATNGMDYPSHFNKFKSIDSELFKTLENIFYEKGDPVKRTYDELKKRTTGDYHDKIHQAQVKALDYAKSVFPSYKFIMPDTLADDWLSTVDWHKKYPTRDHSLHQTLTAYIVNRMLGGGNPAQAFQLKRKSDTNLLDYCANRILDSHEMRYLLDFFKELDPTFDSQPMSYKRRWARDLFYEAAMIAALFHDMGYPWQYINSLKKSIKIADSGLTDDVINNARVTLDAIKTRLLVYPFFGYSEENLKHPTQPVYETALRLIEYGLHLTHGFPGALGFLTLNDRVRNNYNPRKYSDPNYRMVLEWAAVAIMMHDMAKIYWDEDSKKPKNPILRQSFDVDPLSCLISMADILEEFYRPKATFGKVNLMVEYDEIEKVILDYDFPCVGSEVEIIGKRLYVTYYYLEQKTADEEYKRRNDEVLQYLNLRDGYIDLRPWGVTEVICQTKKK